MEMVKPSDVKTPNPCPETYRWTDEKWVDEYGPLTVDMYTAYAIVTAFASEPDKENPSALEIQDNKVFALLRPDLMERVWKSEHANGVVEHRVVQAVGQLIKIMRDQWIAKYGSMQAECKQRESVSTKKDR